jgi:hypothetical protein
MKLYCKLILIGLVLISCTRSRIKSVRSVHHVIKKRVSLTLKNHEQECAIIETGDTLQVGRNSKIGDTINYIYYEIQKQP